MMVNQFRLANWCSIGPQQPPAIGRNQARYRLVSYKAPAQSKSASRGHRASAFPALRLARPVAAPDALKDKERSCSFHSPAAL